MPLRVRNSLAKFGADIALGRRKRGLTGAMMAERIGVSRSTYFRVEKGDPTVSMGVYAMAMFVLGLGTPFADLADARGDELGLALDAERVPKRVRARKEPRPT
ncbi:helix-turn-helix transcriptional regulator [Longimicrobium sp.]|uniref:helix-turn-helix transcriptional regulator n=1 Tax=Longimicrobium sp. TaxID=2029185 RepID=UPI002E34A8A9|nr:helix-turn-helix transcriptional regulator [Longimicrobium sp.]HEX6038227.1 helix-turn-helix transcriptional regulator [Longimicrobium sp.]